MVTKANVPNYLVVAIDTRLRDDLIAKGYNVYYKDISVSMTFPETHSNTYMFCRVVNHQQVCRMLGFLSHKCHAVRLQCTACTT